MVKKASQLIKAKSK